MAFPQTPLTTKVELQLGSTWTDITADVYARDSIRISRGRADEGQQVDAGRCSLTLDNRTGKYSPRNPLSPYYGQIGRNTPIRVSVMTGAPYLSVLGNIGDRASTPDTAALDITGDLDVRIEATLQDWQAQNSAVELVGKWALGQQSWQVFIYRRKVWLYTSVDGTAVHSSQSVAFSVPGSGRMALRATLDVNDGAGGKVNTFYIADSINGPWVQLGTPDVTAGTTSIFNSTSALCVGDVPDSFATPTGAIHKVEVRNGINGAIVANPDFTAQTVGATSFADTAGRTWTVAGGASITNRQTRFHGEVSSWPARWDTGGFDVYVPIEAAGILRRLGQGAKSLDSPLRRRIASYTPLAYWPMEEQAGATQASSPIVGVLPLRAAPVEWAAVDTLPSSAALPVIHSDSSGQLTDIIGQVPTATTTLTAWSVQWLYRLDTVNATLRTFMTILSTGTVAEWYIQSSGTLTRIIGQDTAGATVFSQDIGTSTDLYGQWVQTEFRAKQVGGNVEWKITWRDVGGSAGSFTTTFAGTLGRPTAVSSPGSGFSADLDGMALGHISVWPDEDTLAYESAVTAWTGETAGDRITRLCIEEDVPLRLAGNPSDSDPTGAQDIAPLLELLRAAAEVDDGILYEARDAVALQYRTNASLLNQAPVMTVNYAGDDGLMAPLDPVDDDQHVRNDITVQRSGGSSARATLTSGALSTSAPPVGVGRYDESMSLNLHNDDQPAQHANWHLHKGTWDETRFPVVRVGLANATHMTDAAIAVDVGDRIQITNPPVWLPPDTIDVMVQGYTETLSAHEWTFEYTCTPYGPWNVGTVSGSESGTHGPFAWADTDGCVLAEALDATETAVDVFTTSGPVWVTANPSLTTNPDFETNLTGWFGSGGTITRVPTPEPHPFAGSWSMQFVPNGIAQFPNAGSSQVPVTVGRQYVASGWLRCATTRNVGLNVNWFAAGSVYLSTSSNELPVTAGVWHWFEAVFTAPATAVTANLAAGVANFPPSSDVLWCEGLTLRPAGGGPSNFPFRVRTGGEVMAVNACTSAVVDTFARAVVDGWGTADTGQAWTNTGTAAEYDITGAYGTHTNPAVGIAHISRITSPHTDSDIYCDLATATLATGGPLVAGPVSRCTGNDNFYTTHVSFNPAGTITLILQRRVAFAGLTLDTYTSPLTHTAGTVYRVRQQTVGSTIRAKFWLASDAEPSYWHLEATDTSLTAADQIGVRTFRDTGNTNANAEIRIHRFELVNPQTFTVTRSANAVVKPHAAGADVRLAHPAIVAL